ncbi:MAG: DUF4410 domain-containing protein [Acidobacteria bacterium]|nr:DUF4410 domain-containing protein [Acidobacteriota bacterium]
MRRSMFAAAVCLTAGLGSVFAQAPTATASKPQDVATSTPSQDGTSGAKRKLWIAKFNTDTNAAAAVANIQISEANALQYSELFSSVKTFATEDNQPDGTWTLEAKETSFSGGSAAARALVGWGAGRSHITMEYTLLDPDKKVAWTGTLTTKPSFWGSAGAVGAVQNQGQAVDEQAQKLIDALSKFFNPPLKKKS